MLSFGLNVEFLAIYHLSRAHSIYLHPHHVFTSSKSHLQVSTIVSSEIFAIIFITS